MKISLWDVLFWILFIISIAVGLWYIFGNSPTFEQSIIIFLMTSVFGIVIIKKTLCVPHTKVCGLLGFLDARKFLFTWNFLHRELQRQEQFSCDPKSKITKSLSHSKECGFRFMDIISKLETRLNFLEKRLYSFEENVKDSFNKLKNYIDSIKKKLKV